MTVNLKDAVRQKRKVDERYLDALVTLNKPQFGLREVIVQMGFNTGLMSSWTIVRNIIKKHRRVSKSFLKVAFKGARAVGRELTEEEFDSVVTYLIREERVVLLVSFEDDKYIIPTLAVYNAWRIKGLSKAKKTVRNKELELVEEGASNLLTLTGQEDAFKRARLDMEQKKE